MGVISSSNSLNGQIMVSTDGFGTLVLLDPLNSFAQTVIATGGGYGDFANVDPTTGTLLFSSGGDLGRLSCGVGCGVGAPPPPSGVPEPSSWMMLLLGFGLMGGALRRRRKAPLSYA